MILIKKINKSNNWLKKHLSDPYIKERNRRNLRSRAWFKLKEINESEKIFYTGMKVIDLGSNPGGWSEYALEKIGKSGIIFAYDILPMRPLKNVKFFRGDITDILIQKKMFILLKKYSWNIIMSDMSPNLSGCSIVDNVNMFKLSNIVLKISMSVLSTNGCLVMKLFQGYGFNEYIKKIFNMFKLVKIYKPRSSRVNSREVFIIARKYKI
ncbi:RlmE family RNA methyltransferase [Buchnera aphidicola]|uniref:Ribosomal RNA large subunit methyltransferase E n=1 Tax=Buchnera aphidicola (Cinara laricifoliae) TaxID=2518977 RepID=A0A451DBH9_9GAMM|nr:SAM-dependent methyltransferase [Buchnera aphidicola]VFP83730.1 Ribosomal RNA large subunit methyltransferase E [Buchnera aphidicola (Cinara laricifoliae)]